LPIPKPTCRPASACFRRFVDNPPGFNLVIFVALALVEAAFFLFILFPQWFGFTIPAPQPKPASASFPVWFWIGSVLTLFFWWLMWARITLFGDLVYYAFTPLWWGFILALDGLAYRHSGGYSLLVARPKTLLISALVSVAGWFYFEYFDYFALGNWYYPNTADGVMPLTHAPVVLLFLIAYSTAWPAIFEWYTLLNTFPCLVGRYSNGPKIALPGGLLLWGGLLLIFAVVFFPYPLYVNVIHIFAEMPLLGYIGYLPFGILVWVVFIWAGALFGFDAGLLKGDQNKD